MKRLKSILAMVRLPHLSIRHVLFVITAALTLMIALLSGRDLYANSLRLAGAYELRDAVAISDQLFDATEQVSVERDLALSMLQAADADTIEDLRPRLAESRRVSDAAVNRALTALNNLPDLANLSRQLEIHHDAIQALRPQIDNALTLARGERDQNLSRRWAQAATDLMSDAENLWAQFIRPFTRVDATVTEHLRYRNYLRMITDYTGRERSIIGQILSENADPTLEQTSNLLRDDGVLDVSWRSSRLLAVQGDIFPAIAPQYTDAESHYATLHDMMRELFFVPGARHAGDYPIDPNLWFELSSQASESLAALRQTSRVAARRYLDGMIGATERAIATQVVISLAALILCAFGFWLIAERVIRPINGIVDALLRATRGESVDFDVAAHRDDEIGKLGGVLQAFQHNLQEVRRTASELNESSRALAAEVGVRREAERKTQAQLERLALLHQISRAIGERQDLPSIFQVALNRVETELPADIACVLLFDPEARRLVPSGFGAKSASLGREIAALPASQLELAQTGLARCAEGRLLYEPNLRPMRAALPNHMAQAGVRSLVAAPLQVESNFFGILLAGRSQGAAFSSGECEFLRQLSEHVALAAHQAQLSEALRQAYDDLRQTQDAVMQQERLRSLGQLASGIAHDINNALSPVALYTESLLHTEAGLSQSGRAKLEVVQRAIDDAARTIARMNEFYRKRDAQLNLTPIDLNLVLQQVLDLTQARWRDMPREGSAVFDVRTEFDPQLPPIMGVESELREALTNLVFNAIDAMPDGGRIVLRTRFAGDRGELACVEITDSGVGMDEDTRRRCLEPFFTTKGERGTGLGLAMVYGAVQRHGGHIEIDSAIGVGTTMRLTFAAASKTSPHSESPQISAPHARLRLLIVDDDPILLRSLRDVLEADGHVVSVASDGKAAVSAFQVAYSQGKAFDAVITDLGMPGLDGRRLAAVIKAAAPSVGVILLTGWGERLKAEEEKPPHVDCILSKPPKLREIRAALAQCCAVDTQVKRTSMHA